MRARLLDLAPSVLCAAQDSYRDAIASSRSSDELLEVWLDDDQTVVGAVLRISAFGCRKGFCDRIQADAIIAMAIGTQPSSKAIGLLGSRP